MSFRIESDAFEHNAMIPEKYTADGVDVSPALRWSGAPQETESFALICDDPDAPRGDWVHWLLYDIPPDRTSLPGSVPQKKFVLNGAEQGTNDFQHLGYDGPAPPSGTHRYFFKLYALDINLNIGPGITKSDLLRAMKSHILAEAQLVGKYTRD